MILAYNHGSLYIYIYDMCTYTYMYIYIYTYILYVYIYIYSMYIYIYVFFCIYVCISLLELRPPKNRTVPLFFFHIRITLGFIVCSRYSRPATLYEIIKHSSSAASCVDGSSISLPACARHDRILMCQELLGTVNSRLNPGLKWHF